MSNVFVKIGSGIKWVAKEIGHCFSEIPKLVTLTKDAEAAGSQAIPKILTVLDDVKTLATASVQDSGRFVTDLAALGSAVVTAAKVDGTDIADDEAVLAAFKVLIADFTAGNVADVLAAWKVLIASAEELDATVVADLKKLAGDVA